jgi:hypothetical protein
MYQYHLHYNLLYVLFYYYIIIFHCHGVVVVDRKISYACLSVCLSVCLCVSVRPSQA